MTGTKKIYLKDCVKNTDPQYVKTEFYYISIYSYIPHGQKINFRVIKASVVFKIVYGSVKYSEYDYKLADTCA